LSVSLCVFRAPLSGYHPQDEDEAAVAIATTIDLRLMARYGAAHEPAESRAPYAHRPGWTPAVFITHAPFGGYKKFGNGQ
jgi:hypothetical protein